MPEYSPPVEAAGPQYRCSRCQSTSVRIAPEHPSLDSRWPLGYCDNCTPAPDDPEDRQEHPQERELVPLVRADVGC